MTGFDLKPNDWCLNENFPTFFFFLISFHFFASFVLRVLSWQNSGNGRRRDYIADGSRSRRLCHTHTKKKRIGMIKMMMMTAEFLAAFPNLVKQMIIKLTLSFWCNVDVFFSSARVVMELLNFRSSPCSCLAFLSAAIRNRIRWSGGMQMNDAETSCCFL